MPTLPDTPQHSLCPQCRHRIVRALTSQGVVVMLDTGLRTYRLITHADNRTFRAELGSDYAVHACRGKE